MIIKVKGPDIYIPPLTGKPRQQRLTIRSGVLTSTSGRQRGAVSDHQLPEQTLEPHVMAGVFGIMLCKTCAVASCINSQAVYKLNL